jgi:hypothetical protein
MPDKPVSVSCDLTGTFNNGWTGTPPAWTFSPDPLQVQNGHNKIIWTLTATNPPTGFTAAFTNPGGIVFKPSPAWTGTAPSTHGDGTIRADDNFHNLAANVTFGYTTSVTVTPPAGSSYSAQTFTYDPDVENEAGGGKILAV